MADNGCDGHALSDNGWGRGRQPVINATWEDAQSYVKWLSDKTGLRYRLLSEAEYDYVNRAGAQAAYWWGDKVGEGRANCNGCGSAWDNRRTAPVGSFAPNGFGLYDTVGNVVSWTLDCWNPEVHRARTDGKAILEGTCSHHVLAGGSWRSSPSYLVSAYRGGFDAKKGSAITGFRVAREF